MDTWAEEDPLVCLEVVLRDPRPVSVNAMYGSTGNRRFLTPAGKTFKDSLTRAVARATQDYEVSWKTVVDQIYKHGGRTSLDIWLYAEGVYNPLWKLGGSQTEKSGPRSPYKKMDTTNYIKLIEDAVAKGVGIDDSCNLDGGHHKREDKDDPRVEIVFRVFG